MNFAEADKSLEESKYVIFGVPFDRTASYRAGAREAPLEIRKASYNFETYMYEHDVDLLDIPMHDMGDTDEFGSTGDMVLEVASMARSLASIGRFPIALGGEHSISPPVLEGVVGSKKEKPAVVVVDAHLDFRSEYLGDVNNHACASRRFAELVGAERVLPIGVRSMCKEEYEEAKREGLNWITAEEAGGMPPSSIRSRLQKNGFENVHLSIDIDGIDPAYAPGTGTPEPFGLTDVWVKKLIQSLAPMLVGMDIVEVCPPVDNGNTSALAARLVREAIAAHWKATN